DFANLENRSFPTIFFGYGFFGDWYEMFFWRFPAAMEAAGIAHSYHPVPAAHDMHTWAQLLTIFARDYLWQTHRQER
ncbi:MAG: hypothetical protein FWC65_02115, partial [Treponema sp.]|nr:hypothetical protein [Treponema sp.]